MRSAVEWLRSHGLHALGLLGHSKAGSGVVLYAAKYDDVPRVVNVSGRFEMTSGAPAPPHAVCGHETHSGANAPAGCYDMCASRAHRALP